MRGCNYPDRGGTRLDNSAVTVRVDVTPGSFHAQVLDIGARWYVDPYNKDTPDIYAVYFREDLTSGEARQCLVPGNEASAESRSPALPRSGDQLRTYRLAVATTGEYGVFHGGTVATALAAVVTTINRVTGIFERELAVKFMLVANNDTIIFVNVAEDPFTGNYNSTVLINKSQTQINLRIGAEDYDIGHTFSTGAGGLASSGICISEFKARGVTGGPTPENDPFDVDFVAHEIGHQFAANHTFNGTQGFCGSSRNASTAFEIGSGSTIMAYAGICGNDNLQLNSDALFHSVSHEGSSHLFVGTTEPWPAASLATPDNGSIPLQRVFNPAASPSRFLPELPTLAANIVDPAQKLPMVPRMMNWSLTGRQGGRRFRYLPDHCGCRYGAIYSDLSQWRRNSQRCNPGYLGSCQYGQPARQYSFRRPVPVD